ncbi:S9 family peptidase [Actinorugispora endophytica]|uniref:Dipeptidyl-peptidase-4 n=1 Tax=Actinorugispora endophytica TaxID=1605990 RepID=A0A4R6V6Q1_9ACTN|nr:prolyl oligopeptidase family serine peptidase [Actinorugispora endophytica]TDQ54769.1 dipeptidyl-peptidase-4 [Actinorugispora endophytica]
MTFPRQQARTQRFTIGVPRAFQISPDGRYVAFLRGRHGTDSATCLWTLEVDGGRERVVADPRTIGDTGADLPPEERARRERLREAGSGIVSYSVDESFTRAVFTLSGRLYHVGLGDDDGAPRELPAVGPVVDPVISPGGDSVAYVSGGAIHVIAVGDGADRIVAEPDGENVTWGLAEFIAAEEMGRYRGMWWSPDGAWLLAARVDDSAVSRWHISDPGDPAAAAQAIAYPAAGTDNAEVRLAALAVDGGADAGRPEPVWLEWDREELPYLVTAGWTNGRDGVPTVAFSAQSRSQHKVRVFTGDPVTGLVLDIWTESSWTWVENMPGVPAFDSSGELLCIGLHREHERMLYFGSQTVSVPGQYVRALLDVDGPRILYSASPPDAPGDVRLWMYDREELVHREVRFPDADASGVHSARLRGGTLVMQRRDLSRPGVRTVVLRDVSAEAKSPVVEVASFAEAPELPEVNVRIRRLGERGIPAALVLPSWYSPDSEPLPVLVDPYGGPHAQRVLNAQGAYLTSQWFAEQGFAVLVADGRGTPGISLEWEEAIHRNVSEVVLADQVEALRAAPEAFGVRLDLTRVGIRGWSFGGYLAALAVLRRPDVFHAAVAGAPVTDWRLYDTHYTERYLGHPGTEADGYVRDSLLSDASGLSRPLMLIHGLADDNVVFAHTQRLSSALLAAGRPHTVLPLSGATHMPTDEAVSENLLLLQVAFLRDALELAPRREHQG